jgi:hypothetical protein
MALFDVADYFMLPLDIIKALAHHCVQDLIRRAIDYRLFLRPHHTDVVIRVLTSLREASWRFEQLFEEKGVLELLRFERDPMEGYDFCVISYWGQIERLQQVWEQICLPVPATRNDPAQQRRPQAPVSAATVVRKWLVSSVSGHTRTNSKVALDPLHASFWQTHVCRCAAEAGNLAILQWAHRLNFSMDNTVLSRAAWSSNTELCLWLQAEAKLQWTTDASAYAAAKGDLALLFAMPKSHEETSRKSLWRLPIMGTLICLRHCMLRGA